jgi:epoxyqueuosine reductase
MHNFIKQTALSIGFDACGIAKADLLADDAEFMKHWLDEGKNGTMHWLARNFEKRIDPRVLIPGCKSVIVVLLNYFPEKTQQASAPRIAKYAYSSVDYHAVIKEKLTQLETRICEMYGADIVSALQHTFVDSAPVLERRWAERAGLGWIGKHTQLIHPERGSYCFIGILMLNTELEYDQPIRPRCGSCTRCMDACPTNAIKDGSIDARRCISYLTIESKNAIPEDYQPKLSGCALGCDICADVCPWNKKWAKPHSHSELQPYRFDEDSLSPKTILDWGAVEWQQLSESDFNQVFRHSAVKRAGFKKLKNNIEIIIPSKDSI